MDRKIKKKARIFLLMLLVMVQMIFIWSMDVAFGAVNTKNELTNGFAQYDPMVIYHVSLYGIIAVALVIGAWLAFWISDGKETI